MAELVYAADLKSAARKRLRVRVPPRPRKGVIMSRKTIKEFMGIGYHDDTTLQNLIDASHEYSPDKVFVVYSGCGSHEIDLEVEPVRIERDTLQL